MKRSLLWIDPRGADVYYSAPGNVVIGPSSTGTLVVWAYATSTVPGSKRNNRLLRVLSDPINETVSALHNEHFYGWAVYSGTGQRTFVAPPDYAAATTTTGRCGWNLLAVSWDVPASKLRVFVNGDYDSGWVTCGMPAANALRIYLGPQAGGEMAEPVYLQYVAAWSGNLTAAQISKLHAEGPRYVPRAEDGTGTLTFLATFNEGYGADIAEGDGELYTDLCPGADRYCRIPDGQFEYAQQSYFIGQPAHDGQEFDRLPVWAVFHPGFQPSSYSTENLSTEGRIVIPADPSQSDVNRGPLMPGARTTAGGYTLTFTPLRVVQPPCTFRVRLRLDSTAALTGQRIRLGPIDYLHYPLASANVFDPNGYGSYQAFKVVADAGNNQTVFKTDLDEGEAGYWAGAYCLFLRGANAGRALKVAAYDAATKRLTLEGPLPNQPQAGDVGVVAFWARLQGVDCDGNLGDWQNLEVILDETHGSAAGYFPEIDFIYVGDNWYDPNYAGRCRPNYVRFDRGRTVVMEGIGWHRASSTLPTALYGRPKGTGSPTSFAATVRVQKVQVYGPWQYQLLRADGDEGPSLADNFLVWVTAPGEQGLQAVPRSIKVWRQRNVTLGQQRPTKHPDPGAVQQALQNSFWRRTAGSPWPVEERGDQVVASLVGTDAEGKARLGYVVGTWDGQAGLVRWTDETPPAGKTNPFFEGPPLSVDRAPNTPTVYSVSGVVVPMPDGKWMMAFPAKMSDPDHSQSGLLIGAEDRWSFDRQRHWWRDNPLMGIRGAVDVPKITGGGTGTWANRDASFGILYDRHTEYPARRYLAYARGKSILFGYLEGPKDVRPLIGLRSADGRLWTPLPEGREITPLCSCEHHVGTTFLYDDSTVALSPPGGSLRVSEDGIHWQELFTGTSFLPPNEIPGEGSQLMVTTSFRLGDRRVYYYSSALGLNLATIRYNGETYYELSAGATEGFVETAAIQRPGEKWERELVVNVEPREGTVRAEVIDAATERVIAGFGQQDCADLPDSVEHTVRWRGLSLQQITAETIRLRFWLRRSQAALRSPRLYGWNLTKSQPLRPTAQSPKVNGQAAPAGVTSPDPLFSWTYSDPQNIPQGAYRILVASSEEKLAENTGDVWDSGVVESSAAQATYAGPPLESYRVYFWKVLVRNSEGIWSE